MEKIVWGNHSFKGDAEIVAREIKSLGDEVKPEQIVTYASKHPESELYKCFTWDRDKAADKWLLFEARQIVCNLTVKIVEDDSVKEKKGYRVMYRTSTSMDSGYKPLTAIINKPDEYQGLLLVAKEELNRFMKKYESIKELETLFDTIRTALSTI